jgi:hypothetical protein
VSITNLTYIDDFDYTVTKCGKRCLSIDFDLKKNNVDDELVTIAINVPRPSGTLDLTSTTKFKVSKGVYPEVWEGYGDIGGVVATFLEHTGGLIAVSSGTLGYKAAGF